MSLNQLDYSAYRRTGITAGQEFAHLPLLDFDMTTEIANDDGHGTSTPWIDLHSIPKDLTDWDAVWNWHVKLLGTRFLHSSVRISRLYKFLGIDDPEDSLNPNGPSAGGTTPNLPSVQDTQYVYIEPDVSDKVGQLVDGVSTVTALGHLESIMGTRSYTGLISDGFTWKDFENRDGFWVTEGTTLTHNIDELDQALGAVQTHTGFVNWIASGFWNAQNYKDGLVTKWSMGKNIELLNRSIGSRTLSNTAWLTIGTETRSDQLSALVKTGYGDDKQTVTDYLKDIVEVLGTRGKGTSFPVINISGSTYSGTSFSGFTIPADPTLDDNFDALTMTEACYALSDSIGNRIVLLHGNSFPLTGQNGSSITTWANSLNASIGGRFISGSSSTHVISSTSNGLNITDYLNIINAGIGSRVIINKAASYILQGATDGLTITDYINRINIEVGTREFNQPHLTNSEKITDSFKSLAYHIGNLSITNNADSHPLTGMSNTSAALTGSTMTDMFNALNDSIGPREYNQPHLTNSENITDSIKSLAYHTGTLAITNNANSYLLAGMSNTSSALSGFTVTDMLNTINDQVGDRVYGQPHLINGEIITDSFKSLAYHVGNLSITSNTDSFPLAGMSNTSASLTGSTITDMFNALNNAVGGLEDGGNYTVDGSSITTRLVSLETGLQNLDSWLGHATNDNVLGDDEWSLNALTAKASALNTMKSAVDETSFETRNINTWLGKTYGAVAFSVQIPSTIMLGNNRVDLVDMLRQVGDVLEVNGINSFNSSGTGYTRDTTGWYSNSTINNNTLKKIIQQLVDRIDNITGWGG